MRWPPPSRRSPGLRPPRWPQATRQAERTAARLIARTGPQALERARPGGGACRDRRVPRRRIDHPRGRARLAGAGADPAARSATTPGPGWTPPTVTRTGGCGPTWPAAPSPGTWPPPPACSRSPPGRAATVLWPTSRSTGRSPTPRLLDGPAAARRPRRRLPTVGGRPAHDPEEVAASYASPAAEDQPRPRGRAGWPTAALSHLTQYRPAH